ncbi:META domain-containing protein [Flagellimonas myxillae]|uniref:META domain-containing protein n=1 Tax=Flagellimonas myxillae TaxID=2942214 RepID=UPI00201E8625|nr:META domain-containing protein [Muricauda myxillae]MCL6266819.1 META domain-containing protein [Muricauda myxillae]
MKPRLLGLIIAFSLALFSSCDEDDNAVDNLRIVGEWQIAAIHNSSPSGPTMGPGDGEVISIIFRRNGEFAGSTSANSFSGSYTASDSQLIIEQMITTEAGDTPYGQAFYSSLSEAMDSTTNFSVFSLNFEDNNTLMLEFLGFKFLNLQKP